MDDHRRAALELLDTYKELHKQIADAVEVKPSGMQIMGGCVVPGGNYIANLWDGKLPVKIETWELVGEKWEIVSSAQPTPAQS